MAANCDEFSFSNGEQRAAIVGYYKEVGAVGWDVLTIAPDTQVAYRLAAKQSHVDSLSPLPTPPSDYNL